MSKYKLFDSPGRGRGICATITLKPSDLIAEYKNPLISFPASTMLSTICSACLRNEVVVRLCSKCKVVGYCGPACQKADWKGTVGGVLGHKKECLVFKYARERGDGKPLPTPVRLLMTVMLGGKEMEEKVMKLEGNVERWKKDKKGWEDARLQAYAALSYTKIAGPDKTDYYAGILARLLTNCFNEYDADVGVSTIFLDTDLAMVNHSCIPNASVQIIGGQATLIADRTIPAGQEIFISYVDPTLPVEVRARDLLPYCIECDCERCVKKLDNYQAIRLIPDEIIEANAFSVAYPKLIRNPGIKQSVLSLDISMNHGDIYALYYDTRDKAPDNLEVSTIRRSAQILIPFIQANMWAFTPMPVMLSDWFAHYCHPDSQVFIKSLSILCLKASRCSPIYNPIPWSMYRIKTAYVICKMLPNAVQDLKSFHEALGIYAAKHNLPKKHRGILVNIDPIAMCRMILTMVDEYCKKAHLTEWYLYKESNEMLTQIRGLEEMENNNYGATLELWEKNPDHSGPWLEFWRSSVVEPVEALAELGSHFIIEATNMNVKISTEK